MSTDLYELIAYAARYWFALLAVLVAFYGWRACVTDNRRARILRYQAHGAGCVGELVMLDDGTKKKKNRKSGLKNRRSQKERFMEDHEKKTLYRCNYCTYYHRSNGIWPSGICINGSL